MLVGAFSSRNVRHSRVFRVDGKGFAKFPRPDHVLKTYQALVIITEAFFVGRTRRPKRIEARQLLWVLMFRSFSVHCLGWLLSWLAKATFVLKGRKIQVLSVSKCVAAGLL